MASDADLYGILGVDSSATATELRQAFRRRARTLHPDVSDAPDAVQQFRRLVSAFETLLKRSTSGAPPSAPSRPRGRSTDEAWGGEAASPSSRPAGSRRAAEADEREASERRRRLWRTTWFEEIFRENMPLDFTPHSAQRRAFVESMERAVQAFAGGGGPAEATGEAEDTEAVLRGTANREVLEVELQDVRLELSLRRQRMRALDDQLQQAERRAETCRGTTPATQADRLNAMQRELEFLDQASRLRERREVEHAASERLDALQRLVRQRLEALKGARYTARGSQ